MKRFRRRTLWTLVAVAAVGTGSPMLPVSSAIAAEATKAESTKAEVAKVTFEQDVAPILRKHCLNCHHAGDSRGGLAMDSYSALIEGGGSGEVVFDDGDVEGSRLWQLINHDDTPVMPPSKVKLPDADLKVIRRWIAGGVLENDGSVARAKPKNALAQINVTIGRPVDGGVMPGESFPQNVPVVTDRPGVVSAIATSPWAPLVALAGERQIVFYHAVNHELLGVIEFPEGVAQSIRFSRSGAHLIVGGGTHSATGLAAVYDVATGQRLARVGDDLDTVFDADASADLERIAMGGPQKRLRIFDATNGDLLHDIGKHTDWIYAVAFSPDGSWIASGDRSGGLHLWEAGTGRWSMEFLGHAAAIRSIAWRDDSNVFASASEDGTVRLWNPKDGKQIKQVKVGREAATSVAFDHAGRFAVGSVDNLVRLYDPKGAPIATMPKMTDDVLEVALTGDGTRVVYGDWTGDIWSVAIDQPQDRVSLASNPPTVEERLSAANKKFGELDNRLKTLNEQVEKLTAERDEVDRARRSADQQRRRLRGAANRPRVADDQPSNTSQ